MKQKRFNFIFLLFFLMSSMSVCAQNASGQKIQIVPIPVKEKVNTGVFKLTPAVKIVIPNGNKELETTALLFAEQASTYTGFALKTTGNVTKNEKAIQLVLNKVPNNTIGAEGYTLNVKPSGIQITANKPAGIFYGLQTLVQLLPAESQNIEKANSKSCNIQCVDITDYPRFGWRGLMLDVSRHFLPKEFVKSYIDQLAKYKMNVFHWHLTDNQGWRIEIKGLPELINVGARRVPRTGRFWTFEQPQPGEKATDVGYYTQEEIKEVVSYAQKRFVTIVPEIDVPGHSLAFIATYPDASCTHEKYAVNAGFPHGEEDLVLCAGNEDNFKKLEIIFSEVTALFPGKYFHIGGDEANKSFWKKCPLCQKRMKEEGLKDEAELQSYFIKRMEKILASKGKKLIGWDEILEGGLSPDATVMSWRGIEGGIAAAKEGHYAVMSPGSHCYFDHHQGELAIERVNAGGNMLRVSDVYKYEPVPDGVDSKYILGGQGNVWGEFVTSPRRAEYMTWPRALALAEVFWSPKEKKDWNSFAPRMEAQFKRLEKAKVDYAPSVYDPVIVPVKDKDGKMQLTFSTELNDLDVYYTFNCSFPDNFSDKYQQKPIDIPTGASEIWAITYRNGKPVGRLLVLGINELKGRLGN